MADVAGTSRLLSTIWGVAHPICPFYPPFPIYHPPLFLLYIFSCHFCPKRKIREKNPLIPVLSGPSGSWQVICHDLPHLPQNRKSFSDSWQVVAGSGLNLPRRFPATSAPRPCQTPRKKDFDLISPAQPATSAPFPSPPESRPAPWIFLPNLPHLPQGPPPVEKAWLPTCLFLPHLPRRRSFRRPSDPSPSRGYQAEGMRAAPERGCRHD